MLDKNRTLQNDDGNGITLCNPILSLTTKPRFQKGDCGFFNFNKGGLWKTI